MIKQRIVIIMFLRQMIGLCPKSLKILTLIKNLALESTVGIIKCATLRVNPNVNYGLWVIIMCQCRFIDCNECTPLVGDVDRVAGGMGEGTYRQYLHLPLSFASNLKLL